MPAYDDDYVGYDEIGDDDIDAALSGYDEIGAAPRRQGPTRPTRKLLARPPASTMRSAGAQRIALKRVPLGLGSFTFVFGGATAHTFEVEPQRDYQAERLILEVFRAFVAPAAANPSEGVLVTSIKVGDIEQLPSSDGMPSGAFKPEAVGAEVELSTCKAGTKLKVELTLSDALESGESITCDAGFYGAVVGQ